MAPSKKGPSKAEQAQAFRQAQDQWNNKRKILVHLKARLSQRPFHPDLLESYESDVLDEAIGMMGDKAAEFGNKAMELEKP